MIPETQNKMKQMSDIIYRISQAENFTKGWHSNIRRWRRRYDFDHYDTRPQPNEKRYVDPVLTNVVDLAVGIMQANEWIWRSKGLHPSSAELMGTGIIEKAMAAFIDMNSDRYEYDHKYETNLNFVRDGGACILSVWDPFIHENGYELRDIVDENMQIVEDAKVYYDLPLRMEVIDPLQVYLVPGGAKRWLAVARKEEMTVYDAENLYQVDLDNYKGKSQTEKKDTSGNFVDYWELAYELVPEGATDYEGMDDPEKEVEEDKPMRKHLVVRNAMMFGNEFIRPLRIMDGYGDLPYTMSFYNPASRDDSSQWHSIMSPLENPVRELEDTTNMRKRLMTLYSGLPLVARSRAGKTITIDKKIGKVINLREGEDLGFPKWEGTPPDMDKHLEFSRSRIQQSGFSDVMYGEGSSQSSGYGLSLLTDQNRIRLVPALSHLEKMWTWAARKWVKLCSEFIPNDYLELYGHANGEDFAEVIKGGDLSAYTIRCKIKPEFPNEKVRNHAMATQVAGILPPQIIMEDYLDIHQPDDARRLKIQESVENNPIMVNIAIMRELKKRADTGDEVAAMSYQIMQQQFMQQFGGSMGIGSGGQAPPTNRPPNPEQMTGTQGADGQPDEPGFAGQRELESIQRAATAAPSMVKGDVNGV